MLRSYVADPMDLVEGLVDLVAQGRSYHPPYRTQLTAGLVADFRELVLLIERSQPFSSQREALESVLHAMAAPVHRHNRKRRQEGGFRR